DDAGRYAGSKRVFAGSWDVTCEVVAPLAVFTVRANAVVATPAAEAVEVRAEHFTLEPSAIATAAVLVSRTEHEPAGVGAGHGRPALAEAAYVVAGGRGTLGDFAPVEDLADALGAAVGATRDA